MFSSFSAHKLSLSLLLFLLFINFIYCFRIAKHKIYQDIESTNYCFRRLNSTNVIGCQSESDGNVGILHLINTLDDVNWIIENGSTPPYVVAFEIDQITTNSLLKLKDSNKINGVILLNNDKKRPEKFSPDKKCANNNLNIYSLNNYKTNDICWNNENPLSNFMFIDWEMPIFLITKDEDIEKIVSCYNNLNKPIDGKERSWPLCTIELTSRMNAAKNTPTCMSRNGYLTTHYCDPISSFNIFSSLLPLKNFTTKLPSDKQLSVKMRSQLLLIVRLDSFSMFTNKEYGVNSVLTSIITLLSVAKTLSKYREQVTNLKEIHKNVIFALFDGENWDYIGSSRASYDLKNNKFLPNNIYHKYMKIPNINLESISHIIELNQLTPFNEDLGLKIHTDLDLLSSNAQSDTKLLIDDLIRKGKTERIKVSLSSKQKENKTFLPPSSIHSFLKYDRNISSIVITGFDTYYENKFYNSFLDDHSTVKDISRLTSYLDNISTLISKVLLKFITNLDIDNIKSDSIEIENLLTCFLKNTSCPLFSKVSNMISEGKLFSTYTSVSGFTRQTPRHYVTPYVHMISQLLAYFTGYLVNATSQMQCLENMAQENQEYSFDWMPGDNKSNGYVCVKSQRFLTEALSPAFLEEIEDWNSNNFSTWTESTWEGTRARLFVKPSYLHDIITLLVGFFILISSLFIVHILNLIVIIPHENPNSTANLSNTGNCQATVNSYEVCNESNNSPIINGIVTTQL